MRGRIIFELMKVLGLKPNRKHFDAVNLLKIFDATPLDKLNKELTRIQQIYFGESGGDLKRWRRKIRGWITNFGKPESRGAWVVRDERLVEFKQKLVPALASLPTRNFTLLKEKVIDILEEMNKDDKKPVMKNTCSKHFWYYFLERNPEIKNIYESLPIKRPGMKKQETEIINPNEPIFVKRLQGILECNPESISMSLEEEKEQGLREDCKFDEMKERDMQRQRYWNGDQLVSEIEENESQKEIFRSFFTK